MINYFHLCFHTDYVTVGRGIHDTSKATTNIFVGYILVINAHKSFS